MLTVILAESSLERIPKTLIGHSLIKRDAKRRHKTPEQLLLDRSYHHRAMMNLPYSERRGRPDIVHVTLLTSLGSPLNLMGQLRLFIHTHEDLVIEVSPKLRIPRNSERFKGLMEQLYENHCISVAGIPLLELQEMTLHQLTRKIVPTRTVGLTVQGEETKLESLAISLAKQERPVVVIGGFPRGHFSEKTMKLLDKTVRIYPSGLEAWTVASWAIFAYEQAAGLRKLIS